MSGSTGRRWRWAVLAALATTVIAATSAHAAYPGENGPFVLKGSAPATSLRGGGGGSNAVYLLEPGSPPSLAFEFPEGLDFTISPSGDMIAFKGDDDLGTASKFIYTTGLDSAPTEPLAEIDGGSPAWSADATEIAYRDEPSTAIRAVPIGGGASRLVWGMPDPSPGISFSFSGLPSSLAWSGDGARLATPLYQFDEGAGSFVRRGDIWTFGSNGETPTNLTAALAANDNYDSPQFSPDGTKIVYRRSGLNDNPGGLYSMNASDGSSQQQLTGDGANPYFSPDGTKIAFQRPGELWVMDADGSNEVEVTDIAGYQLTDWGPVPNPCFDPDIEGVGDGDTINGTGADEVIAGTPGDDTISGGGGNDTICGYDGEDNILEGHADGDTIYGGGGNDTIDAGLGDDVIYGGGGNDTILGDDGDDDLLGGDGDDVIEGGFGSDGLSGNAGEDELDGNEGDDDIAGHDGDDVIDGGDGFDSISGGAGNDYLEAGNPDPADPGIAAGLKERVEGDGGSDQLFGTIANDVLDGGGGKDLLYGYGRKDKLTGGNGKDESYGGGGKDKLFARDNRRDKKVNCGGGNGDRAKLDHEDPNAPGCEHKQRA